MGIEETSWEVKRESEFQLAGARCRERGAALQQALSRVAHRHVYLARQDVSEGRESVVQGFVINGVIQVLDEDVSNPRLPEPRVPLGPHDADGTAFDHFKVHGVQGSFSW